MNNNRLGFAYLLVFLTVSSCFGQEIGVSDNLQGLFDFLKSGTSRHALICNAFTTRFDILTEAARRGTCIDVVMQRKYLIDYYRNRVAAKDKKRVVGYSADLHDKIALLISFQGSKVGYLGSANFSTNHFRNTELVLRIPNVAVIPGFMPHIESLLLNAKKYSGLGLGNQFPNLPIGPQSSRRERRGSCTNVELISCFDLEEVSDPDPYLEDDCFEMVDSGSESMDCIELGEDCDQDFISDSHAYADCDHIDNIELEEGENCDQDFNSDSRSDLESDSEEIDTLYNVSSWIADRIKVNEDRNYLISTMTLNYPGLVEQIKEAVYRGNSNFKIIVDKDSIKDAEWAHSVFDLARLAQHSPKKIAIRWKKGSEVDAESSIHHAKLFVRYPRRTRGNGLSVVSTANFTERGGEEFNCALALPHDAAHKSTIRELDKRFYSWWRKAEVVPSKSPSRDNRF